MAIYFASVPSRYQSAETDHPLSHRKPRCAIAECGDHSGQLVPRDRRCPVTVASIGPGRGPLQFGRDESRRMNLNDDVVYGCLRLGPLRQLHPSRPRSLIHYHNCFHRNCLLGRLSLWWICCLQIASTEMVEIRRVREVVIGRVR